MSQTKGRRRRTPVVPEDTFALRLAIARHHAGNLSIEKAAERCGIKAVTWATWERGARPRNFQEAARDIAAGLDVDLDWLVWGGSLSRSICFSALPETAGQVPLWDAETGIPYNHVSRLGLVG